MPERSRMEKQEMSEPEAKPAPETDIEEEQLNQAIEDLRGALHEEQGSAEKAAALRNNAIIMNIPVDVQIMLGSAEMPVSELMALQKGSTVALDRRIGEPVDVVVNGQKIARGEITVLDSDPSRFGVKLTEIITAGKAPR
jgi:flagellar motor switch protein FliN/FliY